MPQRAQMLGDGCPVDVRELGGDLAGGERLVFAQQIEGGRSGVVAGLVDSGLSYSSATRPSCSNVTMYLSFVLLAPRSRLSPPVRTAGAMVRPTLM